MNNCPEWFGDDSMQSGELDALLDEVFIHTIQNLLRIFLLIVNSHYCIHL